MTIQKSSIATKTHILATTARLLLAQGYRKTTVRQIASEAGVSVSSVQNFFNNKEGILIELTQLMFESQFGAAEKSLQPNLPPVYTYAVETAIQLVLIEQNEQLREIYTVAYTLPNTAEFIYRKTALKLQDTFGNRFPNYTENDFYLMEIGSAGLMRNYMAVPCNDNFTLEHKIERFLSSALRIYRVGEEELEQVLAYINANDIITMSNNIIQKLFSILESHFKHTLAVKYSD